MTAIHQSRERANEAAEKLRLYAQPQRLMILSRLLDGEYSVGAIDEATGIGQPTLSQQLAELRRADLVKTRRTAKNVHYRLANADVALCVRSLESMFGSGRDAAVVPSGAAASKPKPKAKPAPRDTGSIGSAAFAKIV